MDQLEQRLRGWTIPSIPKEHNMAALESSLGRGSQKADMPSSLCQAHWIFLFLEGLWFYSKEGEDPGRAEQGNQRGLMYV